MIEARPDVVVARPAVSRTERAITGLLYVVLGLATLTIAWSFSHATWSLPPLEIGGTVFVLATFGLVMCYVVRVPRGHAGRALLVAALCVLLLIALNATNASLRLRWAASESAFARVAATVPAGGGSRVDPSRIGLYNITRVDTYPGGGYLFFDTQGGDLADIGAGFAYLPNGPGKAGGFRHLHGPWYTFVQNS